MSDTVNLHIKAHSLEMSLLVLLGDEVVLVIMILVYKTISNTNARKKDRLSSIQVLSGA